MARPIALAIVALLATGCATRASYQRMRTDLATLRGEVTDLRQAQEATSREVARTAADVRGLDARLTELNTAHKEAVAEVATLRGRLETAETDARQAKASTLPPAPASAPVAPPPERQRPPAPREPASRRSASRAQAAEKAYAAALATFRAREYGQAVLDFLDFMAAYPHHRLVANAQHWIGEAYYVQHDYPQALVEFQKVLDVAPSSPKVPDTLLMMGLCHRNMGDENRARQTWDRVEKDYPGSEAAAKARALLRTKASTATR